MILPTQLMSEGLHATDLDAAHIEKILFDMTDEQFEGARTLVVAFMEQEVAGGRVDAVNYATGETRELSSALFGGAGTNREKFVAFNFTNTVRETFLPIASLVATILTTGHWIPANAPHTIETALIFWKNLVVLRQPADEHAIRTVRAIGTLKIRAKNNYADVPPSTADVVLETALPIAEVAVALERLTSLRVIVNADWGDQADDYLHPNNRWNLSI
jgi:hypothetical protein